MNAPRLLLVTLSNIGDAVLTTPVLQAMHTCRPDAVIDIVCDSRSAEIFSHCPYRGELIEKDKRRFLRGLPALVRRLRERYYDLAVDLRTDLLPLLLRTARRWPRWRGRPYGNHAVERHMGVIARLHGPRPLPAVRVWTGATHEEFAARRLPAGPLLALGPGANWPPKIWPAENFLELIGLVRERFAAVVLLGNAADAPLCARIAAGSALPAINLCRQTGLLEAAAVLRRAGVFVGNDSGLGHLASAVSASTLTLFGPGDPQRYRPWGERSRCLVEPSGDLGRLAPQQVAAVLGELPAPPQAG